MPNGNGKKSINESERDATVAFIENILTGWKETRSQEHKGTNRELAKKALAVAQCEAAVHVLEDVLKTIKEGRHLKMFGPKPKRIQARPARPQRTEE